MGVRHAREYKEILDDLTDAVSAIRDSYSFFEMTSEEWGELGDIEKREVMEALADDVFYGLGEESVLHVGQGVVAYKPKFHVIEVMVDDKEARIVRLV
ncbi:hypothetical protein [Paenibacillus herberti]|uniref:Uncharacterized protein n=1 Tax=Paenibacillus herberti TaxID=1619309 RepID=A0A229NXJ6_9BACL|nr:hypothetical protein [Paenibacillus herberti]OXM14620.1 hypothetical protein CGZ75_17020 [Paenibacillus herberti]